MKPINVINKLNESYDMYNVVEELVSDIENLKKKIDDGTFNDLRTVSKDLELIIKNAKSNIQEAW